MLLTPLPSAAARRSLRAAPQPHRCVSVALTSCRLPLRFAPAALPQPALQCRRRDALRRAVPSPPSKRAVLRRSGDGEQRDGGLFAFDAYLQRWEVPWGAGRLVLCSVASLASFLTVGAVLLPLGAAQMGISLRDLSAEGQTDFVLALQTAETVCGLTIVWLFVRPFQPLPPGLFTFKTEGLAWAPLFSLACLPAIGIAASISSAAHPDVQAAGNGTIDAVLPLISTSSFPALLAITALLAPLLEEVFFRGFMLPSLTKWLPTPVAILLSSALFSLAHFAPRDAPQLFALGIVLGCSYARTRNLAVPIIVHGAWNGGVLLALIALQASTSEDLRTTLFSS
jgi:uncharacterized protein